MDIVTAPLQVAIAVKNNEMASKERERAAKQGEHRRQQEAFAAKIAENPAIVLDPQMWVDPVDAAAMIGWFQSLDQKTRPPFTDEQWTTLLSPGHPSHFAGFYGMAFNKPRDTVVPAKVIEALLPAYLEACKAHEGKVAWHCGLSNWRASKADWLRLRSDYPTVFAAITDDCTHMNGIEVRRMVDTSAREAERLKAKKAALEAERLKAKEEPVK